MWALDCWNCIFLQRWAGLSSSCLFMEQSITCCLWLHTSDGQTVYLAWDCFGLKISLSSPEKYLQNIKMSLFSTLATRLFSPFSFLNLFSALQRCPVSLFMRKQDNSSKFNAGVSGCDQSAAVSLSGLFVTSASQTSVTGCD